MLTVEHKDVERVYQCQPLLSPSVDFPLPGGISLSDVDGNCEEEDNDAS
jgi:hypothetical protein